MLGKKCSKCKELKALECFNKDKSMKNGKQSQCKECRAEYYQENREKIEKQKRKYRQKNKEKITQRDRKYYQEHKEERKQYNREYQQENKEKIAQKVKEYQHEHREEINQYQKNKRKTDPYFRLNCLMSSAISHIRNPSIKQGRSWKKLLSYTLIELRKHLKSTLPKGYTWKDFMQGRLHIDHIIPKVMFKYKKAEDLGFQICWGLDNLRLIPAKENRRKHAKIIKPFQKYFALEVKVKK